MAELEIRSVLVSDCYTNCYLCKNTETNEGFIVDPGGNELKLSTNISKMEMVPKAILLTHGHFDHIGAVTELKKRYNIPVYVANAEKELLSNGRLNLSMAFGYPMSISGDKYLEDGQEFNVAGFDIKFISTPGHTKGSGCFYLENTNVLFSGDTLFCASRGRTDFPGGSEAEILRSIREKLLTLPGNTLVLPGHEESTNIESEKVYY